MNENKRKKNIKYKYQAQIRHINGDIITTIWDYSKRRFDEEIEKAEKNISRYVGYDEEQNENLFVVIV